MLPFGKGAVVRVVGLLCRGPISPWAREVGLHFAAADGMAPLEARAVTLGAGAVRHPVKLGGDPKTPRVAPTKRPGQSTLAGWLFVSALGGDPKTLGWLPRGPSAPLRQGGS